MKTRQLSLSWLMVLLFVTGCSKSNPVDKETKPIEPDTPTLEPSQRVQLANQYIADNKDDVDNSRKPSFHVSPEIGWINDPNGFSEYKGTYNLFYQYHPYSAVWGPMHWGHQTTKDFVKWENQPVAIAPETRYDKDGCFSGTAISTEDKHYLVYTSVLNGLQNQSIAYSYDGIVYNKINNNPILSGRDLPEGFNNYDFRDPKIFKRGDKYYIFCGNADNKGNKQIISFVSDEIEKGWKYLGVVLSRQNVGGIFECPDFLELDNKDILIASPQRIARSSDYEYQNDDSCVYKIGNFSTNSGRFVYKGDDSFEEFDKGFSFYAPQTMTTSDGRAILTAWMKSWGESNVTSPDGWAGSMVLPRELTIKDNHIYQAPVRELANYYKETINQENVTLNNETLDLDKFASKSASISLEIDVSNSSQAGIEVFKNGTETTKIYYDSSERCVIFDRSRCGSTLTGTRKAKVEPIDNKIKLQIILDNSSCEVFVNDGYYTMTGNIFADEANKNVSLFAKGNASFTNVKFNEIEVK